jgi:hypothetical protein
LSYYWSSLGGFSFCFQKRDAREAARKASSFKEQAVAMGDGVLMWSFLRLVVQITREFGFDFLNGG